MGVNSLLVAIVVAALTACDEDLPFATSHDLVPPLADSFSAETDGPFLNIAEIRTDLGIDALNRENFFGAGIRIAILDNGFQGIDEAIGKSLPLSTIIEHNSGNPEAPTRHGTILARLVYELATGQMPGTSHAGGPELILYNANGFSNFRESVTKAIAANVDVILYSQVWEYGGNFNGTGFINRLVNSATARGIHWINAAGNYRDRVWSGPVRVDGANNVTFDGGISDLSFTVDDREQLVKVTLAWNDFTDDENDASDQDLDLILMDSSGVELERSAMVQSGSGGRGGDRWSAYPREIIRRSLPVGRYRIGVKKQSDNFRVDSMVRIALGADSVSLEAATAQNSVFTPADNPSVMTVGARDYEYSSQSPVKPEVTMNSTIIVGTGEVIRGSSTAAAFAAAKLAVTLSKIGHKDRSQALQAIAQ